MKVRNMVALGILSSLMPLARAERTVSLKPVDGDEDRNSMKQVQLDDKGKAEIPFATKSGKLHLKVANETLFVDANDDGVLDDKDAGISMREVVSIPVKAHGLDLKYRIQYLFATEGVVFLSGRTHLQGMLDGQEFTLIDSNLNGTFGERGADGIVVGKDSPSSVLGPNVLLSNAIWSVSLPADKAELTLKPYEGPTGRLTLKCTQQGWSSSLTLTKSDGQFSATIQSTKPALLLPGEYYVAEVNCSKKNGNKEVVLSGESDEALIVAEGEKELILGAPFTMKIVASKDKKDPRKITIQDAQLIDAAGFSYSADARGDKSTLKSFLEEGKNRKYMTTMEYG